MTEETCEQYLMYGSCLVMVYRPLVISLCSYLCPCNQSSFHCIFFHGEEGIGRKTIAVSDLFIQSILLLARLRLSLFSDYLSLSPLVLILLSDLHSFSNFFFLSTFAACHLLSIILSVFVCCLTALLFDCLRMLAASVTALSVWEY